MKFHNNETTEKSYHFHLGYMGDVSDSFANVTAVMNEDGSVERGTINVTPSPSAYATCYRRSYGDKEGSYDLSLGNAVTVNLSQRTMERLAEVMKEWVSEYSEEKDEEEV